MASDKKFIIVVIVVGVAALGIMIGAIGQGNVRDVALFWPEKVEQTVAFQEVDGKVKLVGKLGVLEDNNPTLIMRTSYAYILTIVNEGTTHHRLYIDGLEVQSDLLSPGATDTLTIFPSDEGVYNYFDKRERTVLLGQLKAVTVVPSDEFEGVMKDLI